MYALKTRGIKRSLAHIFQFANLIIYMEYPPLKKNLFKCFSYHGGSYGPMCDTMCFLHLFPHW